jgi:hypothetical protein
MDSAELYLELLDSGERLMEALADEREANVFSAGTLSYAHWLNHLEVARHQVECAAECYAVALRTFRMATISEFAPSELAKSPRRGRHARHREMAVTPSAVRGNRGCQSKGARKDMAGESFPVSTRPVKSSLA